MEITVVSEELKVDGKKLPTGKVSIVLDKELLFLRRNGNDICKFKLRKLKFLDEPKGAGRMLLSADGLKFIFFSTDATNTSIRVAMGMESLIKPVASKSHSTSSSANQRGNPSDGNIQNVHPNRGNSTKDFNNGGQTRNTQTGNTLIDLPKPPPIRVANMRSNTRVSSPIDVESTSNRSQNKTIQKTQYKTNYPELQISGTKSVSISRTPSALAKVQKHDPYAEYALKAPHTSSPPRAEHSSPSVSNTHVDLDLVSPVIDRKEHSESSSDLLSPNRYQGKAERKSFSKSRDTPVINDQPRIKALPESRSKVQDNKLFFPQSILDEQQRNESTCLPPSTSPTMNLSNSAYSGSAVSTGSNGKSAVRPGILTFMSVEKSEKAKITTYSRQTGQTGRPSNMKARDDVHNTSKHFLDKNSNSNNNNNTSNNNSNNNNNNNNDSNSSNSASKHSSIFTNTNTITNTYKSSQPALTKDQQDAKDLARAIADSVLTADAEKEKFQQFANFTASVAEFSEADTTLKKGSAASRGRFEGIRNLGNTCYLGSVAQVREREREDEGDVECCVCCSEAGIFLFIL
jgi:hypothetical protein